MTTLIQPTHSEYDTGGSAEQRPTRPLKHFVSAEELRTMPEDQFNMLLPGAVAVYAAGAVARYEAEVSA